MKRPNLVLIMTDQMRGDCLGVAGHPDVKTPYLDTLAAQGAYFKSAYSACPSCIAARAALMTGMSQKRHRRVGYRDGISWDYPHTLPGELTRAGYQTQCVGKMHVHPPRKNLGFESVELHDGELAYYRRPDTPFYDHQFTSDDYLQFLRERQGPAADINDTGIECNSWVAAPWPYDDMSHPTNWVVTRSIDFLRRRDRTRPFFLMPSFVRPHPPFDAPAKFFDMYSDKDLRPPATGDWEDTGRREALGRVFDSPVGSVDPELRRQAMVGYYACITHLDHQIGRLMYALSCDGALNDTVIIFASDHGELLFDHATYRKALPYQGSVNVPFIMWAGKNLLAVRGQHRSELIELRDIMPTLLDLAGAEIPGTVDGISAAGALSGGTIDRRDYLHGEHSYGDYSNHYIATERDKYVWFSRDGREQYFDLESDPRERRSHLFDRQDRAAALRSALISELDGREEGYVSNGALVPGREARDVLSE